ncbi:MAG TPA: hypothetical protein DD444_16090 [Citreicella sp.]|jgi:uncharacterized membrane protein|nr:hypothetical protein [Citreicella sp.]|tara:strand:+ start:879 stop:1385 length:507 start_codon:yes stop_codon:yes gene_type:complete
MTIGDIVPHLKALHITGLLIWCGALFALPNMMARHDPAIGIADYQRIRRVSHYTYTFVATPAAVIAVIAGTWLILIREVYEPWLYLKLLFVAVLVAFHAWVGRTIVAVAESSGMHRPPAPGLPTGVLCGTILVILTLVLAKPELRGLGIPDWLAEPQGRQLPFDVPSR